MIIKFIFGLLFVSVTAWAGPHSDTTAEESIGQVEFLDVDGAFQNVIASGSQDYREKYVNSDGSVTLVGVWFNYRGTKLFIRGSAVGMCKLFGFNEFVTAEGFGGLCPCAVIGDEGRLIAVEEYELATGVSSITCREPMPD